MIDLVLDTNVIIDFLRGEKHMADFWRKWVSGRRVAISQITRMELLSALEITESDRTSIHGLLDDLIVEGISEAIEKQAVALRRECRIKLPDAIIAATACFLHAPLATSDNCLTRKLGKHVTIVNPNDAQT